MVSGGSGISPFISIIREVVFQSTKQKSKVPGILLICAFKTSADLTMLDLLLPISSITSDTSQIQLQIEAYITRENEQPATDDTQNPNLIRTVWFKPGTSYAPISAALGPNSWLWLCAIISSSFIMFLLFLGIVTRYYIYPIGHGGDEIYHFSFKCLWDMFLVCAAIFLAASCVFLWHKRQVTMEGKQVQNLEMPTPVASPAPGLSSSGDRELESLPHQSVVQATNVHYGARPDLKSKPFFCEFWVKMNLLLEKIVVQSIHFKLFLIQSYSYHIN